MAKPTPETIKTFERIAQAAKELRARIKKLPGVTDIRSYIKKIEEMDGGDRNTIYFHLPGEHQFTIEIKPVRKSSHRWEEVLRINRFTIVLTSTGSYGKHSFFEKGGKIDLDSLIESVTQRHEDFVENNKTMAARKEMVAKGEKVIADVKPYLVDTGNRVDIEVAADNCFNVKLNNLTEDEVRSLTIQFALHLRKPEGT